MKRMEVAAMGAGLLANTSGVPMVIGGFIRSDSLGVVGGMVLTAIGLTLLAYGWFGLRWRHLIWKPSPP